MTENKDRCLRNEIADLLNPEWKEADTKVMLSVLRMANDITDLVEEYYQEKDDYNLHLLYTLMKIRSLVSKVGLNEIGGTFNAIFHLANDEIEKKEFENET